MRERGGLYTEKGERGDHVHSEGKGGSYTKKGERGDHVP